MSKKGETYLDSFIPRCIYCDGVATDKMYLISVNAPGAYFQHWDINRKKGCIANEQNVSPSGKKINAG